MSTYQRRYRTPLELGTLPGLRPGRLPCGPAGLSPGAVTFTSVDEISTLQVRRLIADPVTQRIRGQGLNAYAVDTANPAMRGGGIRMVQSCCESVAHHPAKNRILDSEQLALEWIRTAR
jgi:hypothetical protein